MVKNNVITPEEKEWKEQVKFWDNKKMLTSGVSLYKKLLSREPGKIHFRESLAELLLELGRDKKMREIHYSEARNLFEEVLIYQPNNIYAQYHLGFLDNTDGRWKDAINHFNFSLDSEQFKEELRIKAYCYLAIAHHHSGDTEEAKELFHKAKDLNKQTNNEVIEFARFVLSSPPQETSKPYYMESNEENKYLNCDEYEIFQTCKPGMIILNMTLENPLLVGPKSFVKLGFKTAELLAFLVKKSNVLGEEEIRREVFGEETTESIVRTNICRLRKSIQPCFGESANELIKTHRRVGSEQKSKYQWTWLGEYRIIRRTT